MSPTAALRRRRMRLRSTAPPSFFVTVKPKRGPSEADAAGVLSRPAARGRVSSTKEGVANRAPPLTLRNSALFLSVSIATATPPREAMQAASRRPLGRQALAPLGPAARDHFDAAGGRHAGAEAVPALAHELAGLIGPFHGRYSSRNLKRKQPGRGENSPARAESEWDGRAYRLHGSRSQSGWELDPKRCRRNRPALLASPGRVRHRRSRAGAHSGS